MRDNLHALIEPQEAITAQVAREKRTTFTDVEDARFRDLTERIADVKSEMARAGYHNDDVRSVHRAVSTGTPTCDIAGDQVLTRDAKVSDWQRANRDVAKAARPGAFDRWLRGIVTGRWTDAEEERALSVGTSTAGGYLVPTPLSGNLIDLARNQTRVIQAGAVTVPMTSSTLKVARLTGEGAPSWRNENAAITAGDLTFDSVTSQSHSLDRLVVMSLELFQDSDPSASDVIAHSFAAQLGLELDRARCAAAAAHPSHGA